MLPSTTFPRGPGGMPTVAMASLLVVRISAFPNSLRWRLIPPAPRSRFSLLSDTTPVYLPNSAAPRLLMRSNVDRFWLGARNFCEAVDPRLRGNDERRSAIDSHVLGGMRSPRRLYLAEMHPDARSLALRGSRR